MIAWLLLLPLGFALKAGYILALLPLINFCPGSSEALGFIWLLSSFASFVSLAAYGLVRNSRKAAFWFCVLFIVGGVFGFVNLAIHISS